MRLIFLLISAAILGLLAIMWLKLFVPSYSFLYSPQQPINQTNTINSSTTNHRSPQQTLDTTKQQSIDYQVQVEQYQEKILQEIQP